LNFFSVYKKQQAERLLLLFITKLWRNPAEDPGGILDEIHRVEPSNDNGLNSEGVIIGSPFVTHVV
jgi:hypothetical protein